MDQLLANKIAEFTPTDGNWLPLESLLEEAFGSENPRVYYPAIFNLFERFPEDDGAGVFWSAVHGMEATGDYEKDLLRFFRRYPTHMTRTMLIRIRNTAQTEIEGIAINRLVSSP